MSSTDPPKGAPSFTITQEIGRVTGGEVVGVKIGTQINVYTFGGAGALSAPPRRPRDAAPYKFLDSYTFEDRDLFFGRERLAQQLHDIILSHTTTALIGKAAVGKTSLIHAGLIPTLARDGDIVAFSVRDYTAPLARVRDALRKIPHLALALPEQDSLGALIAAFVAQTERRVVIFFDQFERLFSMPLDYQDEFARQVVAARQQDRSNPLHLVFVLREEFSNEAADLCSRVRDADFLGNVQVVPGLDQEGARRAIAEPLRVEGELDRAVLEEDLPDQYIWHDLLKLSRCGDACVDPAPLQIICSYLYARAQSAAGAGRQPVMSVALYKELGQASGILQSYLSDQKPALGVSDDEWEAIRSLLSRMAETETLAFYHVADLARAVAKSEARVKRWLDLLAARRLVEAREDVAYALTGNYMVNGIRQWFPEQYSQSTANAALERALADWDDQRLLTERRRLRRIQEARALLRLSPKALVLLLRSAVAYETDPHFWVMEIAKDSRMQDALQKLESGHATDPAVAEVAQVLFDAREQPTFHSLSEATVASPVENVRIACALALSTLGADKVMVALQPRLSARAFRERWAAIRALAWMRFSGAAPALPPLAVEPFVQLALVGLRLRAQRVKIASVAASALVGTVLVGIVVALAHALVAQSVGFPVVQFIRSLAIGTIIGGVVGLAYSIADVIAPPSRLRVTMLLRLLAVIVGFALANTLLSGAFLGDFSDPRPLLIGALVGSGFGIGNELALRTFARGGLRHIVLCATGLALTTGLATMLTIWAIEPVPWRESWNRVPWQFAGGVNPEIFQALLPDPLLWIAYWATNIVTGAIIGLGLVGGLIVGDRLADQLERARYV